MSITLDDIFKIFPQAPPASGVGNARTLTIDDVTKTVKNDVFDVLKNLGNTLLNQATEAARKSSIGQKVEATATQQKVSDIMHNPITWIVGLLVLFGLVSGIGGIFKK